MYIEEVDRGRNCGQRRLLLLLEVLSSRRFGITMHELMQTHFKGFCLKTIRRDLGVLEEFGLVERRMVSLPHNGRPGVMVFRSRKSLDLFSRPAEHGSRETC